MSARPRVVGVGPGAPEALEECLAEGGVAIFPADGVYGLCCDPLDGAAVSRIHAIKGRDEGKSSAVLYFSPLAMRELVSELTPRVADAVGRLLPGPVTLILPNPSGRYPLACREDPGRLGVRLIAGPLDGMPLPIFQTSANRAGAPSARSFDELDPEVLAEVDLAIDAGELPGVESTVVDLCELEHTGEWEVLRSGAMDRATLERFLGG